MIMIYFQIFLGHYFFLACRDVYYHQTRRRTLSLTLRSVATCHLAVDICLLIYPPLSSIYVHSIWRTPEI